MQVQVPCARQEAGRCSVYKNSPLYCSLFLYLLSSFTFLRQAPKAFHFFPLLIDKNGAISFDFDRASVISNGSKYSTNGMLGASRNVQGRGLGEWCDITVEFGAGPIDRRTSGCDTRHDF